MLSFCFVDPFDLSIKFSTVERLALRRVDFLFVLALHMDANRNVAHYCSTDNRKVDEFLGLSDWRNRWHQAEARRVQFPRFLAESFSAQMERIGYLPVAMHQMKQIRSDVKNLPLYHLALFSKHQRAFDFWDKVLKHREDQTSFDY